MNYKKYNYDYSKKVKEVKRNGWYKISTGCYVGYFDKNPFPTPDELGNARKKLFKYNKNIRRKIKWQK